jgi:hypothetical protein
MVFAAFVTDFVFNTDRSLFYRNHVRFFTVIPSVLDTGGDVDNQIERESNHRTRSHIYIFSLLRIHTFTHLLTFLR